MQLCKNSFLDNKAFNWVIFILLSFIWGSSFILMKKGLVGLTALQVASIRIISSGLVLLPTAIRRFRTIPKNKMLLVFLSGVQGSLLPAYLFCIAEERLDSALAGTLNALTPVFTIILGALFFKNRTTTAKFIGIFISLTGSILLFLAQPHFQENNNALDVLYIIIATMFYGLNVNMVGRHLRNIPSLHIVAVALVLNAVPAAIVLYLTGYFSEDIFSHTKLAAAGYTFLLGVMGTAVASVIFYMLIKRAGIIFSSMVTYAMPAVAVIWGLLYGEKVGWKQVVCLVIILSGVYIANRANRQVV